LPDLPVDRFYLVILLISTKVNITRRTTLGAALVKNARRQSRLLQRLIQLAGAFVHLRKQHLRRITAWTVTAAARAAAFQNGREESSAVPSAPSFSRCGFALPALRRVLRPDRDLGFFKKSMEPLRFRN